MLALKALPPDCSGRAARNDCQACDARLFSVCAAVQGDDLQRLGALAEKLELEAGEPLIHEGDPARHVFNITSGSVRVFKLLPDGRRQITGFLFAGDFLGLAAGDGYVFSAEAIEPASACRFRKADYRALVHDCPSLETALLDRAQHELAAAQNQMLLLGRKTALERLASFLLDLPRHDPARAVEAGLVRLPMTRAEIADYLGLTIETVSRVLTRLKTQGVIRMTALNELRILQPEILVRLAEGDDRRRAG